MKNSRDLAAYLKCEHSGATREIKECCSVDKSHELSLSFSREPTGVRLTGTVLVPYFTENEGATQLLVKNPRLTFAKVAAKFFSQKGESIIHPTAVISPSAVIGEQVSIGAYSVIGDHAKIGDGTVLNSGVIIGAYSRLGMSCYIKSGAVIGEDGFGFDFEEDGTPVRLPHLGKVIIGNNVEVGAGCTISRGTLDDTVIADSVKIDDQVHIAHNCRIGTKTIITAQAELSGSVVVGEGCWIGPNTSIIQKVSIGDGALVGIGAVVNRDVKDKERVMGFHATNLRSLRKVQKSINYD